MIQTLKNPATMMLASMTMLLALLFSTFGTVQTVEAQCTGANDVPQCYVCEGAGGTYSNGACGGGDTELIEGDDSVFESIINILSFVVGAVAVIMLIIGGFRYVISNGDANAVGSAKNTILYAIIGLIVVFAARSIVLYVVGQLG